jgi:PilZ domain
MAMEVGQTPPGWWLASDGRSYPPELHPDYRAEGSVVETATGAGRRRAIREGAGWRGTYRFDNQPGSAPLECQVLDISVLGAGIEIFEPIEDDAIGRKVTVDAYASDGVSASIRFVGTIRGVRPGEHGGTRVGIEFLGLSEERLRVGW